jgi:FMN-dependent NADH-azoreductase
MTKLLFIESSPRKELSDSSALAKGFLKELQKTKPDLEIDILDLWTTELPSFDDSIVGAKYSLLQGGEPSSDQAKKWKAVTDQIERFASADIILISVPMWNFNVPYKLKHYIDVIVQPNYTIQPQKAPYDEWGLLSGKKAVVISTSGGPYPAGSPLEKWNLLNSYLEKVLQFIGIRDIEQIVLDCTGVDLENLENRKAEAQTKLNALAQQMA